MSHRRSSQSAKQTCMHDNRHAAFIHAFQCTTLRLALVHMVEILKIAYGRSWTSRKGAGAGIVGQSGDINQKSVAGSACRWLPAESAGMWYRYVIYCSYHAWSSESDSEWRQNIGMQNIIRRKERLVVNNSNIRLDYDDWACNDS